MAFSWFNSWSEYMFNRYKQSSRFLPIALAAAVSLVTAAEQAKAEPMPADDFSAAMEKYLENDQNVEKIGDALERYFKNKQKARAEQESEQLDAQFDNPIKVDVGSSPIRGEKDAPITIIEFSEFQCPYCKRGSQTMHDVMKEYPGKVNWVFKHLPLPFHPKAKPAAKAALAAGEQGKFWEMHDKLFENQSELGDKLYFRLAEELGLDVEKFKADYTSEKFDKQIEDDLGN
jgi:protein-disulfide isomerase